MPHQLGILFVLLASAFAMSSLNLEVSPYEKERSKPVTCAEIFCGAGRECVDIINAEPYCDCVDKCREPKAEVCGSDGVTYESECELNRISCATNNPIEVVAVMACEQETEVVSEALDKFTKDQEDMELPLVCLEKDRDVLHKALIDWLTAEEQTLKLPGSYKGMLKTYFDLIDANEDGGLDTMEFMKLLEKNETVNNVLVNSQHRNPIIRGLCVDALIQVTDLNSDYKLTFAEFHKCMDPDAVLPKTQCELDGIRFNDGQSLPQALNCNTCTCACGNWVCTTLACDKK